MTKRRKKASRKRRKSSGLQGLPPAIEKHINKIPGRTSRMNAGGNLASAAGGVAMGSLLFPKWSPWVGLGIGLIGWGIGNSYVTNFGVGCALSPNTGLTGTNGISDESMEGFSMDLIKDRAKSLAETFKNKFTFPKKEGEQTTEGLYGDEATYFVNPLNALSGKSDIDLKELDRISNQVAQMNGLYDIDPIDRNF